MSCAINGISRASWSPTSIASTAFFHTHHVAPTLQDAGVMSLNAGVDVDLGANAFAQLCDAVKSGKGERSEGGHHRGASAEDEDGDGTFRTSMSIPKRLPKVCIRQRRGCGTACGTGVNHIAEKKNSCCH